VSVDLATFALSGKKKFVDWYGYQEIQNWMNMLPYQSVDLRIICRLMISK
jgi:hypothetical protein